MIARPPRPPDSRQILLTASPRGEVVCLRNGDQKGDDASRRALTPGTPRGMLEGRAPFSLPAVTPGKPSTAPSRQAAEGNAHRANEVPMVQVSLGSGPLPVTASATPAETQTRGAQPALRKEGA